MPPEPHRPSPQRNTREWVHVIVNAHCSWLHGSARGFRSRRRRIVSSGDYRNPPPATEHAGLRRYFEQRARPAVEFSTGVRAEMARAFVAKMRSTGHGIIACSVSREHLHALVELPGDLTTCKRLVGRCKQAASHAVRDDLPGRIWSAGGKFERVRDPAHLRNAYVYIRLKQERGTVVWSHRTDENWIDDSGVPVVVVGARRT